MRFLFIFLLSFSIFAADDFSAKKDKMVIKMREDGARAVDVACVENAQTTSALNTCRKNMKKYKGNKEYKKNNYGKKEKEKKRKKSDYPEDQNWEY